MKHRVFVYGTLMKDRPNHNNFLRGQEYLGQAILKDYGLYDLGAYPGVVPESGEKVLGEVYEVDDSTLKSLDRLEGNGTLYNRQTAEVLLNGEWTGVEVYVWNGRVRPENKVNFDFQPWGKDIKREAII